MHASMTFDGVFLSSGHEAGLSRLLLCDSRWYSTGFGVAEANTR